MDTLKKTASAARIAANRRNAQNSTGPRSEEGKAQSRLNALKHGLTAKEVVLPTEDAQAYQTRFQEWHDAYQPAGPAEKLLLERAVQASWRLERCARAETARLNARVAHAADDFERDALDRAEELGRRLLDDPIDTNYTFKLDPVERNAYERRRAEHPAVLKRALEATSQGVDWLLARWKELEDSLKRFGTWQIHEAYAAARLLGRRPEDATEDALVTLLILNMIGTYEVDYDRQSVYEAFSRARKLDPSRPIEMARIEVLRKEVPATVAEAQDTLNALMSRETARLGSLKSAYLDDLSASDRAAAIAAAHFDDSPAAVLSRRYETACERELRRTLGEFQKVREEAPPPPQAPVAVVSPPAQPQPRQEVTPSPEPPAPPLRNEPKPPVPSTPVLARRAVDDGPSGEFQRIPSCFL